MEGRTLHKRAVSKKMAGKVENDFKSKVSRKSNLFISCNSTVTEVLKTKSVCPYVTCLHFYYAFMLKYKAEI